MDEGYVAAKLLATHMINKFYPGTKGWQPREDIGGVLIQIEDMTTGLERKPVEHPISMPQNKVIEEMVPQWVKAMDEIVVALTPCAADFCRHESREHKDSCGCLHPGCECDTFIPPSTPAQEPQGEIPEDLLPIRKGHGYDAGCECDLGFDPDCKIQPQYERTYEYVERLIHLVRTAREERDKAQEALRDVVKQFPITFAKYEVLSKPAGPQEEKP